MDRIGIIGAGVVGKVLAAHLSAVGHPVWVVDVCPEEVEAINAKEVRVIGARQCEGRVRRAVTSLAQLTEFQPTLIIVCVKATVQQMVAEGLEAWDTGKFSVVCFQNGLDPERIVLRYLPAERVLRGVVNYAGATVAPGVVKMTFFNPPNYIGPLAPASQPLSDRVASLFTEAAVDTESVAQIANKAWRKTILNAVLVPIAVITRLPMNHIMGLPDTRRMVVSLIDSFLEVAEAEGQHFEPEFKEHALAYLDAAGEHRASMLMDFEAGTPLEIEFINGRLQRLAERHGIPCRANRHLLALIRGLLLHRDLMSNRS